MTELNFPLLEQADGRAPRLQFDTTAIRDSHTPSKQHWRIKSIDHIGTKAPCYFVLTAMVAVNLTSSPGAQWLTVVPFFFHKTTGS